MALRAERISAETIELEPLRADHADEMVDVLAADELYAFTGGQPPTLLELRLAYASRVIGPGPESGEAWLNWIVRERASGAAIGFVQATVRGDEASVAWVIGAGFQGRGFARAAAVAMADWLRGNGVPALRADIHPDHAASQAVARALGLSPTGERVDGEVRWRG
jgi:RimJ/RimL family protein N-acetyltransferase